MSNNINQLKSPILFIFALLMFLIFNTSYSLSVMKPKKVSISIFVVDIDNINTHEQNFTANVYFEASWNDPTLAHKNKQPIIRSLEKVWNPRLQFVNEQKVWKTLPEVVEIASNGDVTYRQRVWGNFSQPLQLHNFPLDKQKFILHLVAVRYTPKQVEMLQNTNLPSGITKHFSQPDWKILSWNLKNSNYRINKDFPITAGMMLTVTGKRYVDYYIFKFIVPLLLIVGMASLVFWIPAKDSSTRINITTTSVLTLITYRFIIAASLPQVPYLTRLDIFILAATILVFCTLIISLITSNLTRKRKLTIANRIDHISRLLLPFIFIFIMILPFIIYPK